MATEKRKGGLGRGLASLIPNSNSHRIGDNAADVIFGRQSDEAKNAAQGAKSTTVKPQPKPAAAPAAKPAAPAKDTAQQPAAAQKPRRRTSSTTAPSTPAAPAAATTPAGVAETDFGAEYREIPIELITPNPKQPRQVFEEEALDELVHSIREFGLMQPVIVRPAAKEGTFELIMGERRLRASTAAGLTTIPAIVRNTDDHNMLRDALLENIHRVQLNPLEEGAAYAQLLKEFGVTQAELADRLGRSRPVISNMIRLLELPMPVQRKVAAGVLSAGHARALLGLKTGPEAQIALADRIVAEGLSVRATEEEVLLANGAKPKDEKRPVRAAKQPPEFATRAADRLADGLDTKVTVAVGRKNRGRIIVEFAGEDDLERIMGLLNPGTHGH